MPELLYVQVDASGLNAAIKKAMEWSHRTPAEMVNTITLEIAIEAQKRTPFVTQQTIDNELGTIVTPRIGKRGKPLSIKQSRNRILSGGKMVDVKRHDGSGRSQSMPLSVAIIQSSVSLFSRYNALTNFRWFRIQSPFKGVSREAGRLAMRAAEHRLIAARHSSTHFLAAGWIPAIRIMWPFSVNKFRMTRTGPKPAQGEGPDFGNAYPAREGKLVAEAGIANQIGYTGKNAENYNRALLKYGMGPLQAAVDNQGRKTAEYAIKKGDEELLKLWNAAVA